MTDPIKVNKYRKLFEFACIYWQNEKLLAQEEKKFCCVTNSKFAGRKIIKVFIKMFKGKCNEHSEIMVLYVGTF